MQRLKQPRLLVWQYEGLKLTETVFAILILGLLIGWSVLLGLACGINLVNDGENVVIVDHLTQSQAVNCLYDILREGFWGIVGLVMLTLMARLARKLVRQTMQNSITRATTMTRLVTSTGKSVRLPVLKANSPWRRQTMAYSQVKRAPSWVPVSDSKLDRQARKQQQKAWREQEQQAKRQRLADLASDGGAD
ncbi:hypothetical protein LbDm2_2432 [Levilactobacillus brevis]|uniref:hypothetical protein n=1 Tax=Levilactobacillus brevis TaxID=1580 RepID=UPI00057D98A4|nr:hypothetical protein [Levilactobacillus brevis]KID42677.1 hypothetical protein LbDm2_2432 [Levilactobacillus brevis]